MKFLLTIIEMFSKMPHEFFNGNYYHVQNWLSTASYLNIKYFV